MSDALRSPVSAQERYICYESSHKPAHFVIVAVRARFFAIKTKPKPPVEPNPLVKKARAKGARLFQQARIVKFTTRCAAELLLGGLLTHPDCRYGDKPDVDRRSHLLRPEASQPSAR